VGAWRGSQGLGLQIVRRQRPDVVFLDIRMPELSGIEGLERLRLMQPPPAVVFTTAFDQYAVTAFELEAVDYLLKPFGQRRFLAAVENAPGCRTDRTRSCRAPRMEGRNTARANLRAGSQRGGPAVALLISSISCRVVG